MNLFAVILMVICIIMRFTYLGEVNLFFTILTIYLIVFLVLLVLAELKRMTVRIYFNFLDTKVGRGIFIMFLTLLIMEKDSGLEIGMGIVLLIIALFNIFLGWGEGSDSGLTLEEVEAGQDLEHGKARADKYKEGEELPVGVKLHEMADMGINPARNEGPASGNDK
jgi:hypothetical protein